MLIPLAVGVITFVCTIFAHALPLSATITIARREKRLGKEGVSFWGDFAIVALIILFALVVHLIEIALWALVFVICGEFQEFGTAYYHSAVNYTTLGYGDLLLSPKWRLLVCRIVNVFTNGSQWCMLASCLSHLRLNCPSPTQIASSYSRLAVIAAHPEELFSASTLSLARPRELPITFWHVTWLPLCQPYCYGGGDLTAAG